MSVRFIRNIPLPFRLSRVPNAKKSAMGSLSNNDQGTHGRYFNVGARRCGKSSTATLTHDSKGLFIANYFGDVVFVVHEYHGGLMFY